MSDKRGQIRKIEVRLPLFCKIGLHKWSKFRNTEDSEEYKKLTAYEDFWNELFNDYHVHYTYRQCLRCGLLEHGPPPIPERMRIEK